ncbi:MAG TPA: hypothetical protein VFQ42_04105 [Mycobacterium sp.]|nr:hypothetical protein [Mycobacterium sp.]
MIRYTLDEIRTWPAVVDLVRAGAVFRIGRGSAYLMAAAGTFPVPVMKVGRRWRVSTAAILTVLESGQAKAKGDG